MGSIVVETGKIGLTEPPSIVVRKIMGPVQPCVKDEECTELSHAEVYQSG